MTFSIDVLIKKIGLSNKIAYFFLIVFVGTVSNSAALADDILRLQIKGQSSGLIDIRLNKEVAPQHVKRIKLLTKEKQYDGVVFHRVIPNFMAQTGDVKYGQITSLEPALVGMGGSEYPMLVEEFSQLSFVQGTVGMARSQDPNSANSQFFIMLEPAPHLNEKYTIVGEVVSGMDVVKAIKKGTRANNGAVESPDFIAKAEIITNNQ
jgi:peptidylprolyl isomerase